MTILYILVGIIILGLAYYLSGRILAPAKEEREAAEAIETPEEHIDIWQGFAAAHDLHPPVFKENDSWGSEAVKG